MSVMAVYPGDDIFLDIAKQNIRLVGYDKWVMQSGLRNKYVNRCLRSLKTIKCLDILCMI